MHAGILFLTFWIITGALGLAAGVIGLVATKRQMAAGARRTRARRDDTVVSAS